jgi:myogenesis-regulating glycosidase
MNLFFCVLIQMNMVGYPLVLPDMIGGNGYNNIRPSKEIFLRWLQANVFMPSLQFSFVPWDYDAEVNYYCYYTYSYVNYTCVCMFQAISISRKFVNLHETYTPYIMERFKLAVASGEPVNPPIWWIAPQDKIAQTVSDEFMLGDKILVAPVIEQGMKF